MTIRETLSALYDLERAHIDALNGDVRVDKEWHRILIFQIADLSDRLLRERVAA